MEIFKKQEYGFKVWEDTEPLIVLADSAFNLKWWEYLLVGIWFLLFTGVPALLLTLIWS